MRLAIVLLLGMAGCSSLYETYDSYDAGSYVVRSGDTLYSIAFRHGVDTRDLQTWNRIANPNRIYVGQRLVLGPVGGSATPAATPTPPTATASAGRTTPATPAQAPARNSSSAPARSPAVAPARSVSVDAMPPWRWPVEGQILARFGDPRVLSTGIGISGRLGQPVRSAAAGRVVYAGDGLPDYGQLVIIEHNGSWLSAYGHNRRLLVSQGQVVAAGETIAEIGPGPGGEPRLHFEIRRNGDPLDPLSLLPNAR